MNTPEIDAREEICRRICDAIKDRGFTYRAFEELMGWHEKTISNWRRGLSHSYMHYLPEIAQALGTTPMKLLEGILPHDHSLESEEEALLLLYRKSYGLPTHRRRALFETIESIIRLYLADT